LTIPVAAVEEGMIRTEVGGLRTMEEEGRTMEEDGVTMTEDGATNTGGVRTTDMDTEGTTHLHHLHTILTLLRTRTTLLIIRTSRPHIHIRMLLIRTILRRIPSLGLVAAAGEARVWV
jgi:hypothetical protein